MTDHTFPIPTTRLQFAGRPHECVIIGPLCANFSRPPVTGPGWYVTHLASGCVVGEPWRTLPQAIAAAGALLALPIDWTSREPTADPASARIALAALQRVRSILL